MSEVQEKAFVGINVGKKDIVVDKNTFQMVPVKIYLKENGALDENSKPTKPSFAILMTCQNPDLKVIGQLSLEMLNEGLIDVGYQITEIPNKYE